VTEVAAAFFSFTEVTRAAEHRAYNEWHMLDHLPEQYTLAGVAWGERWVSTPACRQARRVSGPLLDAAHYLTMYLLAPPVDTSLDEFGRLGRELRERDRFHQHRRPHLTGAHDIVGSAAAERVLVSPDAVPYRPHLGLHVRVDHDAGGTGQAWLTGDHLPALVDVPGVAGGWVFRRRPGQADERFPDPPALVTVTWLDGPPLDVAAAIGELPAPPDGALGPVFEGPFERIEVSRWDWFDR
jgi:hypothetical protein